MRKITLKKIEDSGLKVKGIGFTSHRYLTKKDGLGYTVCRTEIPAGGPYKWQYLNHMESCLCIKGRAKISDGSIIDYICPGDMYVVKDNEAHTFIALEDTVLISVFNPPLIGHEVHDENNSYTI